MPATTGNRRRWTTVSIATVVFVTDKPSKAWQAPTGTIRLTYRFREDTHAYWKYTHGWKGGHFNATSSLFEGVTDAKPEQIDAWEMGLRGSWFNGRLGLDGSLFYYDYKDYQIFTVQQSIQGPEFVVLNANDARVYGSEIDLVGRPWYGRVPAGSASAGWTAASSTSRRSSSPRSRSATRPSP